MRNEEWKKLRKAAKVKNWRIESFVATLYIMRITYFVSVAAFILIVVSCKPESYSDVDHQRWKQQNEQYENQLKTADDQIEQTETLLREQEAQSKRAEMVLKEQELQLSRQEKLLDRSEQQADRYDKILDAWEAQIARDKGDGKAQR